MEAKEETGFGVEGQAHGSPPGREVTSFHTLSSWLPPLARDTLNPERPRAGQVRQSSLLPHQRLCHCTEQHKGGRRELTQQECRQGFLVEELGQNWEQHLTQTEGEDSAGSCREPLGSRKETQDGAGWGQAPSAHWSTHNSLLSLHSYKCPVD